ncbi:MAG: sigma 54-interacting transcriptional regulator [Desulfohalobiaceae bacterium]
MHNTKERSEQGTEQQCADFAKAGQGLSLECYELILNSIYNGVMVTDLNGYVMYMNQPYGEFLELDPKEQIGKHCTQVVENTRMHIVARTGKTEINMSHKIKGQNMVVQRIPIRKNGRMVAVFGQVMFKNVKEVAKLASKLSLLESKVKLYEQELMNLRSTRYTLQGIVGESQTMQELKAEAQKAAINELPVLLTGESGTGKEVFAQAIHHAGPRKMHPFVRINCSAIPRDLLESEFFGYAKGAFTGALSAGKPGKFELAHNGTIFLDEIGELPLEMQPKLLRVLEDKQFERVGGTKVVSSDFRLIAATNQDLEGLLYEGKFRSDLYYRLNVIPLHIPPLRNRPDDIPALAEHLLKMLAKDAGFSEIQLSSDAEKALQDYHWPGNVRELNNILERTLASLDKEVLEARDFPFYFRRSRQESRPEPVCSLRDTLQQAEKEAILKALQASNQNKVKAAQMLGIHRTLLYKKMHKLGLDKE